ncbi:glycoside hydrolase family 20 protein [Amniculicola lignicola CBS 123094]|uniref:Beta-hexosaminidase n=1 Tax=Amniculicola lignicola CBS 123094 TaxID=1392246 RepID=A0A6A5X2M4_9PLEO|nr:glycoside hydrolase family 20 protein [Amniculicola lignicola CBS 123094]
MNLLYLIPIFVSLATAIWPLPTEYEHGDAILWIRRDIRLYWDGAGHVDSLTYHGDPDSYAKRQHYSDDDDYEDVDDDAKRGAPNTTPTGNDLINFALRQTWRTIFRQNFFPWKLHPRDWEEPEFDREESSSVHSLTLSLLKNDPEGVAKPLAGEVDESYTVDLPKDGHAKITANSSVGILRGLNSFTQLFFANSDGKGIYTPFAPATIFDAPKFQHRGINLDVSRNYFPVSDVKRMIDAAAYVKMNRFHLHATDGQSWPLEIPSLPNLAKKGAYRPELIYTVQDFRELQRYATLRGVEFITEVDMPGHTSSIHHAYPDLIVAFNKQPDWNNWAAEPPSGTLKLNSSAVNDFLKTLFEDLLPRVHPYSSYFHTGGDEVNKNAYKLDDTVRSSDPAILQPLMQEFIDRIHGHVRSQGLTPIVWEEMLLEWNLKLGDDVIVQTWRSNEAVAQTVAKGHKALVGNYKYWYLDCGKGQWLDFAPLISSQHWPYNDYCYPFHNWRLIYSYDPLAGIPPESHHLILGGEAHMWSEQTDPVNLDRMVWPRAAAVAEILWSGAKDTEGRNRSQIEASPRLSEMRERLVARGVGAEPVQMPYCTMEGEVCQLGLVY